MSEPWLVRPYEATDEDGVVYCWLKSFSRSAYGKSVGANVSGSEAERAYWTAHQPIVMGLLASAETVIACDREAPEVMWGFACMATAAVHYALVKRRFDEDGTGAAVMRSMLGDRLKTKQRYTHELVEFKRGGMVQSGLMLPSAWNYNPFILARRAA